MSTADEIRIRYAGAEDAHAVHSMLARLADSTPAQIEFRSSVEDIRTAMADETPAIYAFLAERAGKPAGVIVFFMTYSTWYGAPGVYVQDLFVAKASRGEGVGKLLLAAAARWAAARGATHLKLSVDADNQPAQAFYESTGFTHRDDELMYMIGGTEFLELAVEP